MPLSNRPIQKDGGQARPALVGRLIGGLDCWGLEQNQPVQTLPGPAQALPHCNPDPNRPRAYPHLPHCLDRPCRL